MPNRLAAATSAYLRSAAHQPVDWYPWGPEPFARAATEGKPVLLDIGAVWCHWCHVMDGESYEDPGIAEFLNRHFVAVKVDRDERPDVDIRYQRAVQAMTGQGGWPLTAFLNGRGEVFFGGTYFPPEGVHGRPGFLSVLRRVVHVYQAEPERVAGQAHELRTFVAGHLDESAPGTVDRTVLAAATDRILSQVDARFGGFGASPKFPHPGALVFLLDRWLETGSGSIREAVIGALDAMANGGFHDQLGGGFHRYSTDQQWIIPHFEKMATDNAALLRAYARAARTFRRAGDRAVVADTARWIAAVLADPAGGFGVSQDADRGMNDDGDYFTWSIAELDQTLEPDEVKAVVARFGIGTEGRMPHDPSRNVLFLADSLEEVARRLGSTVPDTQALLDQAVAKLGFARQQRPVPMVDRTRYASTNAALASAMLDAGALLADPTFTSHAERSLIRLRAEQPVADWIQHAPGGDGGLLEDQVQVANAAIDLFEWTGAIEHLDWGAAIMRRALTELWDPVHGGFFDRPLDPEAIGLLADRAKPIQDSPDASANGLAGVVLGRLIELTGDAAWVEPRRRLVELFAARAEALGLHAATYLTAFDWLVNPATHVVITGPVGDPVAAELHRLAFDAGLPRRVLIRLSPALVGRIRPTPALVGLIERPDQVAGYLCLGDRCLAPAGTVAEWRERLDSARER